MILLCIRAPWYMYWGSLVFVFVFIWFIKKNRGSTLLCILAPWYLYLYSGFLVFVFVYIWFIKMFPFVFLLPGICIRAPTQRATISAGIVSLSFAPAPPAFWATIKQEKATEFGNGSGPWPPYFTQIETMCILVFHNCWLAPHSPNFLLPTLIQHFHFLCLPSCSWK